MSWSIAGVLAACLVVPALWGWLTDAAFRALGLARYFPLRDPHPPVGRQSWDFQI